MDVIVIAHKLSLDTTELEELFIRKMFVFYEIDFTILITLTQQDEYQSAVMDGQLETNFEMTQIR